MKKGDKFEIIGNRICVHSLKLNTIGTFTGETWGNDLEIEDCNGHTQWVAPEDLRLIETETKETTKTMKRFEDYNRREVLIDEILSEDKYRALAALVKSYGIDTTWIDKHSFDPTHPMLGIDLNDSSLGCWMVNVHTRIPLSDFIECLGNYKAPRKPIQFKYGEIVPNYSTQITEKGIEVGCTTITFENFKKLNEAVEEFLKS